MEGILWNALSLMDLMRLTSRCNSFRDSRFWKERSSVRTHIEIIYS
jgi:hypothetical protein